MQKTKPEFGSYVQTKRHAHRGRVKQIHERCPESRGWFAAQQGLRPEQYQGERWVSILTHPSGSVVVPMSDVEVVEAFDFQNPWAAERFPSDAPPAESKEIDGSEPTTPEELGTRLFHMLEKGFYISDNEDDDDYRRVVGAIELSPGNDGELEFVLTTEAGERFEVLVTKFG